MAIPWFNIERFMERKKELKFQRRQRKLFTFKQTRANRSSTFFFCSLFFSQTSAAFAENGFLGWNTKLKTHYDITLDLDFNVDMLVWFKCLWIFYATLSKGQEYPDGHDDQTLLSFILIGFIGCLTFWFKHSDVFESSNQTTPQ